MYIDSELTDKPEVGEVCARDLEVSATVTLMIMHGSKDFTFNVCF
jgi:hypothetical protein